MKLADYLDFDRVIISANNNKVYAGTPIVVNYSDETKSGEDEIVISRDNSGGNLIEIKESEIMSIKIVSDEQLKYIIDTILKRAATLQKDLNKREKTLFDDGLLQGYSEIIDIIKNRLGLTDDKELEKFGLKDIDYNKLFGWNNIVSSKQNLVIIDKNYKFWGIDMILDDYLQY